MELHCFADVLGQDHCAILEEDVANEDERVMSSTVIGTSRVSPSLVITAAVLVDRLATQATAKHQLNFSSIFYMESMVAMRVIRLTTKRHTTYDSDNLVLISDTLETMSASEYPADFVPRRRFVEILSSFEGGDEKFSLRGIFEFVDSVPKLNVSGKKLSSNVLPLFANAILVDTLQVLCDYIGSRQIGVRLLELEEFSSFCVSNVLFQFSDELYRQIDERLRESSLRIDSRSTLGHARNWCCPLKDPNCTLTGEDDVIRISLPFAANKLAGLSGAPRYYVALAASYARIKEQEAAVSIKTESSSQCWYPNEY
ncbi:hypothetical protein AHF37_05545 [Paragonimus kellicotti]|nr:hypothetical protein AHF37_05545 [Paragonimus kellicotti]